MPRAAAFFDLDRTLMSGSSGQPWVRAARRAGLISRRQLAGWIVDPQRIKPGNHMPPNALSSSELEALLTYLESLK